MREDKGEEAEENEEDKEGNVVGSEATALS